MKVFWSWQSDTPGKIGRHFVRAALEDAIAILKEPPEIEEPSEGDARVALHLDHDRKDVSGSPDLAPTIFTKIEQTAVFVADVTLVGIVTSLGAIAKEREAKKLINSNVAIEYGYALHAVSSDSILMVQNRHFGAREELPFDLRHKAGPIQYSLAPEATATEIAAERARLRGELVNALRPYLGRKLAPKEAFQEIEATTSNPSVFFGPSEVLARIGVKGADQIEYTFSAPRAFYLRLIPTSARVQSLKFTELDNLVRQRRLDVLSRVRYSSLPDRNRFGAITYEPHGTSSTPQSFTQAFTSGELWAVTTEFFIRHGNETIVPTTNVENIYGRVLENFCSVASENFGIEPPFYVELGAVGLSGVCLGIGMDHISASIHRNDVKIRRTLNDLGAGARKRVIDDFLDELFDLAGEKRLRRFRET